MLQRLLQTFRCDLAVDLGTANTLVAIPGEGLVLDEPSVVAVDQASGKVLSGGAAVGHMARQMQGRTPQRISVVRPLAGGVVTDFVLCEAMLRYFLRKAQPPGWRLKPQVLLGVPGSITPVEKRAVFNSVQRAGARAVWVMPEAKAAAIGAGLPIAEPLASMICNVGGGTTEVAVMSLGDMVAAESVRTGGDRMDRAIVDYLHRRYSLRIGLPAAERLRIDIGSAFPLEEELVAEVSGADAVSGLPRRATIGSEEVRHALEDPLEEIVDAMRSAPGPVQSGPGRRSGAARHGALRRRRAIAAARSFPGRAERRARPPGPPAAGHRGQGPAHLLGAPRAMEDGPGIQRRRGVNNLVYFADEIQSLLAHKKSDARITLSRRDASY